MLLKVLYRSLVQPQRTRVPTAAHPSRYLSTVLVGVTGCVTVVGSVLL